MEINGDLIALSIVLLILGIYFSPKIRFYIYKHTGKQIEKDVYMKYLGISYIAVFSSLLIIPALYNVEWESMKPKEEKWVNVDSINEVERLYVKEQVENYRKELKLALERIVELKDVEYCKSYYDIPSFFKIIENTQSALKTCRDAKQIEIVKNSLRAFQIKNFPLARECYYINAKKELWDKDIEVLMNGNTIKYISFRYILNEDKKYGYESVIEELKKLRFKKVGFGSIEGRDEAYWNINSKDDSDIF